MPVVIPKGMNIGYIEGVGDNVASVLTEMGVPVTIIKPADIPKTNLKKFTAIVVGTRAYAAHEELLQNNKFLLDYVQKGGRMVVQYGQYEMDEPGTMPYPIKVARPHQRVTIEEAPVKVLDPKSPILNSPNKITGADWNGWVQERSLYMPGTFDSHYTPVIEMNDPGENPNQGAILVAKYGKGTYIYTTLSLFRQLPAGVPGGAKLLINMLYSGRP